MITKVLYITSVIGLICSLSMIILYQSTKMELESLQSKHRSLEGQYSSLVLSKEQLEASNKVNSDLIFSLNVEITKLKQEENKTVVDLLSYRPKCVQPKTVNKEAGEDEVKYVDIDTPFDPELLRLYKGSNSN